MNTKYLFPHHYRMIGLIILIPSIILGLLDLIMTLEPAWLDFTVPSLFDKPIIGTKQILSMEQNNLLNEIIGLVLIVSSLMVAFSKEKVEDEFIEKVRLESLVWAVYVNYGVLLIALFLLYEFEFIYVIIFNMFTILWFFIIRYQWNISKLKKSLGHEE